MEIPSFFLIVIGFKFVVVSGSVLRGRRHVLFVGIGGPVLILIRLSPVVAVVVAEGVSPVQIGEPFDAVVHHRRQTLDWSVDKIGSNITNPLG